MVETQSSVSISTKLARIAEIAKRKPGVALETLAHHIVFGSLDSRVYLLSLEGEAHGSVQTHGPVFSSPALLSDGTIVIGSYDEHLYFINDDGVVLATFHAGGKLFSSPAVLPDDTVVCATVRGHIHFIRLQRN